MFNLLPESHKKAVRREYLARFWSIAAWFLFGVGILLFASLLPSYFLSVEREKVALSNQGIVAESLEVKDGPVLESEAKAFNERLALFLGVENDNSAHDFIEKIITGKTSSISIMSFTLKDQGDGDTKSSSILMVGIAKDRASLAQFSKNLEQYPGVTKVELPVSNFAKDTNIEFSIRAEGNF